MTRFAYRSTVTSRPLLVVSFVLGVGVGTFAAFGGPAWVAALAFVVVFLAGTQLSVVHLSVGAKGLRAGYGFFARTRRTIAPASVAEAWPGDVQWPGVVGVGVPARRRMPRLTVRPGSTLHLLLRDGELLRASTAAPEAAIQALHAIGTPGGNP